MNDIGVPAIGDYVIVRDYEDDSWTGTDGTHILIGYVPQILEDHPFIVLNTVDYVIDKWSHADVCE